MSHLGAARTKAAKHAHEAVREDYHRIVYAANRETAEKAREAFLWKWKKLCPAVLASLEEAGAELLTLRLPGKPAFVSAHHQRHRADATGGSRESKNPGGLPSEDAVLRVFFGLWVSGQIKLRRIRGYREIGGKEKAA